MTIVDNIQQNIPIFCACSEDININQDRNAEGNHLSLEELGIVLGKLSEKLIGKIEHDVVVLVLV
jgi:hypothetical protein